jgi:tRNA nucleotidyltransferase (CCA-adding enzyme)
MFRTKRPFLILTTFLARRKMTTQTYGVSKNGVLMKVELNEKENKISNLLQGVSKFIQQERPELPPIVSRIAGGWVRDKLLGKECHDLDIAINDMMGYEYATYVNKYLESRGIPVRSIAKIDCNPEKSKHLETATTKLFNQEVDFCNLRTEIYEQDSRIPSQIVSCCWCILQSCILICFYIDIWYTRRRCLSS